MTSHSKLMILTNTRKELKLRSSSLISCGKESLRRKRKQPQVLCVSSTSITVSFCCMLSVICYHIYFSDVCQEFLSEEATRRWREKMKIKITSEKKKRMIPSFLSISFFSGLKSKSWSIKMCTWKRWYLEQMIAKESWRNTTEKSEGWEDTLEDKERKWKSNRETYTKKCYIESSSLFLLLCSSQEWIFLSMIFYVDSLHKTHIVFTFLSHLTVYTLGDTISCLWSLRVKLQGFRFTTYEVFLRAVNSIIIYEQKNFGFIMIATNLDSKVWEITSSNLTNNNFKLTKYS